MCGDKSSLIAYLYGECDAAERASVERHLATCADCSAELDGLRGVRATLREWTPPEAELGVRVVRDRPGRRWLTWPAIPAWAQAAAATLVLATAAAIANVDVRIGNGGLDIRTGWRQPAAQVQAVANRSGSPATASREDLAALERRLRHDLAPMPVPAQMPGAPGPSATESAASASGDRISAAEANEMIRRVQLLIDQRIGESERRQRQAYEGLLATRLVQFARDVDSQRRADLLRIQQGLGQVEGRTTSEVAQLREVQRYLMRVANIQEIK